jgi:hypothetical protein
MGSPGNEMKVEVTQKNVPLTGVHDGSECHPGRTGFRYVEFLANTGADQARNAGMSVARDLIVIAVWARLLSYRTLNSSRKVPRPVLYFNCPAYILEKNRN